MAAVFKLNSSFLNRFISRYKKRKIILAVLLLIVLISLFIFLVVLKNSDKNIASTLDSINKKGNMTCQEVIKSVGNTSAEDIKDLKVRKNLLETQMTCFADDGQYDRAIDSAQKLRLIYISQNDKENTSRIEQFIQNMKDLKTADNSEVKTNESP